MKISLNEALKFTLKWEGNYSNHPADKGGPTNRGIIQSQYDKYRDKKNLQKRSVQFITNSEVLEIYENFYWEPVRAKWLQAPLALVLFDTAVNFGVSGAIRRLQQSLKVKITGKWTQEISDVIHSADAKQIALEICKLRIAWRYYRVRKEESQKVFLKGWLNRDNDLIKTIQNMDNIKIMSDDELIDIEIDDLSFNTSNNEEFSENYVIENRVIEDLENISQEDLR